MGNKIPYILLGIIVFGCANGQRIFFSIIGSPAPSAFLSVNCDADVPGGGDVTVTVSGIGGMPQSSSILGSGIYRGIIFFIGLATSDSGTYTCSLMVNGSIVETATFALDVSAGTFLSTSVSLPADPATAGVNHALTCSAMIEGPGSPPPSGAVSFLWLGPDGRTLSNTGSVAISSSGLTSSLELRPARQSQVGRYTCQATLNAFTATNFAELEVDIPKISVSIISSGTPILGRSYSFRCVVNFATLIHEDIDYTLERTGFSTANTASLPDVSFEAITLADAGVYQCSVVVNSPYIKDAITMTTTPEEQTIRFAIPTPPVSVGIDLALPVPFRSSPTLTCTADLTMVNVDIAISLTWTGPSTSMLPFPLQANDNIAGSQTSYEWMQILPDIETNGGDGDYVCSVTLSSDELTDFITPSGAGFAMLTVAVQDLTAPSPPSVTQMVLANRHVSLAWTQSPFDIVDMYSISVTTSTIGCAASVPVIDRSLSGSEMTYMTSTLEEFSNIDIVITAMNQAGEMSSMPRTLQTPTAAPDGIPQGLDMASSTASSITISWDRVECLIRNGDITGYRVTYGRTGSQLEDMEIGDVTGTETANRRFTALALLPRTSYTFNVMAVNSVGQTGPASTIIRPTSTPEDVRVVHEGQQILNNSIVTMDDIGEDLEALFCFTNREDCCGQAGPEARWLFPDDTVVTDGDVYESRGPSSLSLNIRSGVVVDNGLSMNIRSGVVVDNGLFRCEIPDAEGVTETLYIGVYSIGPTLGVPAVYRLDYNSSTGLLTCSSTGGPAADVVWQRNGAPETRFQGSKLVTNTMTATYDHTLLLDEAPESVIGSYSCSVGNSRGTSRASTLELQGLQVTGLKQSYVIGDNVSVNCSTDLKFDRLLWLDAEGAEMLTTSEAQLTLSLDSVTEGMDSAQFICRAESELGDQMMEIMLVVERSGGSSYGAIAGGVVGGLIFLLLCAAVVLILIFGLFKRCRWRDSVLAADQTTLELLL